MIKPPRLQAGDLVRVVAPASHFDRERFNRGVRVLEEELGLRVKWRDDLFTQQRFLAGDDSRRVAELHEAFQDADAKAIFCARGGYGSARVLNRLDASTLQDHPKVFMGFSDITAVLSWAHRNAELVTFHGPMVTGRMSEGLSEPDRSAIERTLMTAKPAGEIGHGRIVVAGSATGPLIGGSLSMLAAGVGTSYQPVTDDAIVFLEDVAEKPYRIDRMLRQLLTAGLLDHAAALAFGEMVGCDNPEDPENGPEEIIADFATELGIPCVVGLPFGHGENNRVIPFGVQGKLVDGTLTVTEAAVV